VTFQEYLTSKKIDAKAFSVAEPAVFHAWEQEFAQMHPNSFTVQKLNLINPIRRKYLLPLDQPVKPAEETSKVQAPPSASPTTAAPKVARPMIKPKPKIS